MNYKFIIAMAAVSAIFASCCGNSGNSKAGSELITKEVIEVTDGMYTPEIMHRLGKVSDPQVSPDGTKILYGVSYTSIEQNKSNRELFVMNLDGSENHQITNTPKSESNARWIKGGEQIAFLSGGSLWTMNADGSNRKQINGIEGIDAFELSPAEDKIMYISNIKACTKPTDIYPDLKQSSGRTITGLMYRHWDHFVEEIPHTFIAQFNGEELSGSVDILGEGGELFELPTLPFGGLEQLSWSPDGKYIAYSCRKVAGKEYAFSTNTDIYLYNVETKECTNLTEGMMGYDTEPLFSPDGKYLAWISMERGGYEADKRRLFVADMEKVYANLSDGSFKEYMKELSADYKYNVEAITWAPESDKIYFNSCVNALTALFVVDINKDCSQIYKPRANEPTDETHYGNGVRRITADDQWFDFDGVQIAADKLITTNKCLLRPAEIVAVNIADGAWEQLTFENKETLDKLKTPTIEQRWMTTVDGKKMHTWIVFPPEFDKSKKYPAILLCLGGPQGTISQGWSTRWNYRLMASQGYIVILPNRRGTTAFGQEWCEQISKDYCGLNIQDYLTAADNMKKEPYVGKMAATGASYGGYSVYYLGGVHKNRFSALIAHAGIFNQEQMYMMTEEMWFPTWDNGGAPWDTNKEAVRHYSNSPHKLIKNWNTPILITHGEMDYRVPVEQGMAAFNAAQMMGVPSQMLLFPEENHWILRPQNSIHWNRVFFSWLDKYCK